MALLDAWRHRDFRLVLAGQAVSLAGDAVFTVALAWQALLTTGYDPARVGLVTGVYFAGQLALFLVGGVLVDRLPRRLVVATCDLAQLVLCAALAILIASGALTFPLLLALALLFGMASALAMPAMLAFLPETVPTQDYASANSLYNSARTVAMIVGAALGGLLIGAAGTSWAFGLDALTFGVSAACVLATRMRPAPVPRGRASALADAWAGARYVARVPWIWIAILLFSAYNFVEVGPRNVGLPFLLTGELGVGAAALGLVNAAAGVGGLLAALAVGAWVPRERRGVVAYSASALVGVVVAGLALAPTVAVVAALSLARGACFTTFGVLYETAIGEQVDPAMRGRVASLDLLGSYLLLPLSPALTGWLIGALGVRSMFLAAGALLAAGTLLAMLAPKARRFEMT